MDKQANQHRGFKLYIGIVTTLSLLTLITILVVLLIGARSVVQQTKTITPKVDQFMQQIQNIDNNIHNLNLQLQQQSKLTNTVISSLPKP